MSLKSFNCLNVGVGGQGVISATQMLAHAAMLAGYNVRTAETHGMAQRGGSVTGYLRFGDQVEGSLIPRNHANIIMSFEPSEAFRNRNYANSNTSMFINTSIIMPLSVYQNRKMKYPKREEIEQELKEITPNVYFVDASQLAKQAGNMRTVNVIMIGVMAGSGDLPLERDHLEQAIMKYVPSKAKAVNRKAFELGIEAGRNLKEAH